MNMYNTRLTKSRDPPATRLASSGCMRDRGEFGNFPKGDFGVTSPNWGPWTKPRLGANVPKQRSKVLNKCANVNFPPQKIYNLIARKQYWHIHSYIHCWERLIPQAKGGNRPVCSSPLNLLLHGVFEVSLKPSRHLKGFPSKWRLNFRLTSITPCEILDTICPIDELKCGNLKIPICQGYDRMSVYFDRRIIPHTTVRKLMHVKLIRQTHETWCTYICAVWIPF